MKNKASCVEKQLRLCLRARKNILNFVSKAVKNVGRLGNLKRKQPSTLPNVFACRFEMKFFQESEPWTFENKISMH